ncbi:MAG: sugar-binding domain-containing protein, partial [Myxococcota bacterium]|nr:sugar-binding domain-containing protein [Myxococcota bacterium]
MSNLAPLLLALILLASGFAIFVWSQIPKKTVLVPLATRFAADLDPENPLPEYPRPQLRRDRWQNLNGRWQFEVANRRAPQPREFSSEIVVPFPVESALSGANRRVTPREQVWYRREFEAPTLSEGERLLLHFGAVDWQAEVWLNGVRIGVHEGGFDPFYFDVTDALAAEGSQKVAVSVWDPTTNGQQSVGKQSLKPRVITYTAVTGIWQTVWLEPVAATRVEHVAATTHLQSEIVSVRTRLTNPEAGDLIEVVIREGERVAARVTTAADSPNLKIELSLPNPRLWSPESPFLYDLDVVLSRDGRELDRVASYFGAREITTARDDDGIWRLFLNGEPVFHLGLLDQGYWPDGLYTAPTDEALAFDIEATKQMGFNTIRKHVKVEPARWYWHADRLGVLVWQDMPSGDGSTEYAKLIRAYLTKTPFEDVDWKIGRRPESAAIYRRELDAMLEALDPFTSIVVWVPFNEAWGQFETDTILEYVAARDPSRLVDGASGWTDTGSGHIRDFHLYRRERKLPPLEPNRPIVYGEFGGLARLVEYHLAVKQNAGWGYKKLETDEAFEAAYLKLLGVIEELRARGLAGAIYTQTTDIETEINGLISYDRAVF